MPYPGPVFSYVGEGGYGQMLSTQVTLVSKPPDNDSAGVEEGKPERTISPTQSVFLPFLARFSSHRVLAQHAWSPGSIPSTT